MTGLYPHQQRALNRIVEELNDQLAIEARLYQLISAEFHLRQKQNREQNQIGNSSPGGYRYCANEASRSSKKAREALFQLIGNGEPEDEGEYE